MIFDCCDFFIFGTTYKSAAQDANLISKAKGDDAILQLLSIRETKFK